MIGEGRVRASSPCCVPVGAGKAWVVLGDFERGLGGWHFCCGGKRLVRSIKERNRICVQLTSEASSSWHGVRNGIAWLKLGALLWRYWELGIRGEKMRLGWKWKVEGE